MAEEIKQRSSQTRVRKGSFGEIVKLEKEKHAEMVERERLDRKKKQRLAAKRKRKVLRKAREEEKAAEKEKLKPKKAVKAKDSKKQMSSKSMKTDKSKIKKMKARLRNL